MVRPIPKRDHLVALARRQLGKPYRYGALVSARPRAFDCSSLVAWLYAWVGVNLPRVSLDQAGRGRRVPKNLASLKVGDLIFFTGQYGHYNLKFPQGIGHVALYLGQGRAVHARSNPPPGKVAEVPLQQLWRRRDLVVIKRVLS